MGLKTPERFDPFTDRTARDIRNSLSEAFVAALGAMDAELYQSDARQWGRQDLAPLYGRYIDDRLQRYAHVLTRIRRGGIRDPLQQALIIWNRGLFFEFHDHLEALWKTATGDRRQALKGLIKAAGVYIHLEQHHEQAARSLAIKAHALLEQYKHCLTFIANRQTLLDKLKTGDPEPPRLEASFARD